MSILSAVELIATQRVRVSWFSLCLSVILLAGFSLSHANEDGCPANSKPVQRTEANGEIVVSCQCVAGYTKFRNGCERIEKVNALKNGKAVNDAVAQRELPPFEPLWNYYQYNRDIAKGLAPEENRCAIVLSMTLGLEPRSNEASMQDLGLRDPRGRILAQIKNAGVIPEIADADLAKRYYIRAQQLANRLRDQWGAPVTVDGSNARAAITGKKGVIFIQDAYGDARGGRTGDHIDVWNGNRIGSSVSLPFEKASKVWFWEIP